LITSNTILNGTSVRIATFTQFLPFIVLLIGSTGIALTAFYGESYNYDDLGWHQDFAERLYSTGNIDPPISHIGYHIVLIGLKFLFPFVTWRWLGIIVMTGTFVMLAIMIYRYLLRAKASPSNIYRWMVCFVSLLLLIMTPITIFTWSTQNLYLGGYISPTVYHNPTVNLLRPIAFAQFLIAFHFLTSRRVELSIVVAATLLNIVALFVKPSYAIALLPALSILTLWRMFYRQEVAWRIVFVWFGVLNALLIIGQYYFLYISNTDSRGSVIFAPLQSLESYEPSYIWLALKLGLSIAFPVFVTFIYWQVARKCLLLVFAWLCFFFSVLPFYLLNETAYPTAGNFWWGAQVCLFILMIVSARFWITQQGEQFPVFTHRWSLATIVTIAFFLLHSVSAVFWWGTHVYQTFSHVSWRTWW
jgi:hypothetical protein